MFLSLLLNIILILSPAKKVSETSFCSSFKKHVSFACAFKIFRPFFFSAVKKQSFPQSRNFFTAKKLVHNQEAFPQSRNFSTDKELFHIQETCPQSRNFCTINKNFHSQGKFPQNILLDQGNFLQTMKFSAVK